MNTNRRRLPISLVIVLAVFAVLFAFVWYIGAIGGNRRTVVSAYLYRSGQLKGAALQAELAKHHINTVINLRGPSSDAAWYRDEVAACTARGIGHVDITLWASRLPEPLELANLLKAYDTAKYPVLIHCQGGSDRSGLAAAIYRAVYRHEPVPTARSNELTWRYGHFRSKKARAMDEFFDLYQHTANGVDLRTWILKDYPALYRKAISPGVPVSRHTGFLIIAPI